MDDRKNNTKSNKQAIKLFISKILDDPAWPKLLGALSGYDAGAVAKSPPREVKSNKEKASVEIEFSTKHAPLRVRIKTFKGKSAGNQLERCNHSEFCCRNKLHSSREFLASLWLSKAANPRGRLVDGKDNCQRIAKLLTPIKPWATALRGGNNHPQVLALYNSTVDHWHLYDMKDVLNLVRKQPIGFTSRCNIHRGKYIVVQRRGKEGKWGTSLTNIDHRSNDVQMKIKAFEFYHDVEPLVETALKRK